MWFGCDAGNIPDLTIADRKLTMKQTKVKQTIGIAECAKGFAEFPVP